jgi:hypothetical protein
MNRKGVEKSFVGLLFSGKQPFLGRSTAENGVSALSRYRTDMTGKWLFIGKKFRQGKERNGPL